MFVLEDGPFLCFFHFVAVFPDAHISLNSTRSRPAASSLPAGADLTRSPRIQYTPTTLSQRRFTATKTALPN
jgi:hypothetical protein